MTQDAAPIWVRHFCAESALTNCTYCAGHRYGIAWGRYMEGQHCRAGAMELRCDCPRQSLDYEFAARSTTPPSRFDDCPAKTEALAENHHVIARSEATWQSPSTALVSVHGSRRFPEGELPRRGKRSHPGVRPDGLGMTIVGNGLRAVPHKSQQRIHASFGYLNKSSKGFTFQ